MTLHIGSYIYVQQVSHVQHQEKKALCNISFDIPRHPREVRGLYQAQGIPAILNAIRTAADTRKTDEATVELIAEGVNLLAAIASHQECRPLIMQHGGIEITLQVMRFYIDFPIIQEHCLRILSGLTLWPEAAAKLLQAGYIDCIIAAMRKYPEHQGVQMSGAYALGMVAGSDDAKNAVLAAAGIEVLVAAMCWHPMDQHVNEQACAALSILSEPDRGKAILAKTSVDEQSSAEIVANSMRGLYSIAAWLSGLQVRKRSGFELAMEANTLKQIAKLVAIAGLDDTMRPGCEVCAARVSGHLCLFRVDFGAFCDLSRPSTGVFVQSKWLREGPHRGRRAFWGPLC